MRHDIGEKAIMQGANPCPNHQTLLFDKRFGGGIGRHKYKFKRIQQ